MSWRPIVRHRRRGHDSLYVRLAISDKWGLTITIAGALADKCGWRKGSRLALDEGADEDRSRLRLRAAPDGTPGFSLGSGGSKATNLKQQTRARLTGQPERLPTTALPWRSADGALIVTLPWDVSASNPEPRAADDVGNGKRAEGIDPAMPAGDPAATAVGRRASAESHRTAPGYLPGAVHQARRWTPAEDAELRRRWGHESRQALAASLRRSVAICEQRASKLGLTGRKTTTAASAAAVPGAAAPPPRGDPRPAEIARHIAEHGVTPCPPVYCEKIAGGAPLAAPPPAVYDKDKHLWRRERR